MIVMMVSWVSTYVKTFKKCILKISIMYFYYVSIKMLIKWRKQKFGFEIDKWTRSSKTSQDVSKQANGKSHCSNKCCCGFSISGRRIWLSWWCHMPTLTVPSFPPWKVDRHLEWVCLKTTHNEEKDNSSKVNRRGCMERKYLQESQKQQHHICQH